MKLMDNLFKDYNCFVLPVKDHKTKVQVTMNYHPILINNLVGFEFLFDSTDLTPVAEVVLG